MLSVVRRQRKKLSIKATQPREEERGGKYEKDTVADTNNKENEDQGGNNSKNDSSSLGGSDDEGCTVPVLANTLGLECADADVVTPGDFGNNLMDIIEKEMLPRSRINGHYFGNNLVKQVPCVKPHLFLAVGDRVAAFYDSSWQHATIVSLHTDYANFTVKLDDGTIVPRLPCEYVQKVDDMDLSSLAMPPRPALDPYQWGRTIEVRIENQPRWETIEKKEMPPRSRTNYLVAKATQCSLDFLAEPFFAANESMVDDTGEDETEYTGNDVSDLNLTGMTTLDGSNDSQDDISVGSVNISASTAIPAFELDRAGAVTTLPDNRLDGPSSLDKAKTTNADALGSFVDVGVVGTAANPEIEVCDCPALRMRSTSSHLGESGEDFILHQEEEGRGNEKEDEKEVNTTTGEDFILHHEEEGRGNEEEDEKEVNTTTGEDFILHQEEEGRGNEEEDEKEVNATTGEDFILHQEEEGRGNEEEDEKEVNTTAGEDFILPQEEEGRGNEEEDEKEVNTATDGESPASASEKPSLASIAAPVKVLAEEVCATSPSATDRVDDKPPSSTKEDSSTTPTSSTKAQLPFQEDSNQSTLDTHARVEDLLSTVYGPSALSRAQLLVESYKGREQLLIKFLERKAADAEARTKNTQEGGDTGSTTDATAAGTASDPLKAIENLPMTPVNPKFSPRIQAKTSKLKIVRKSSPFNASSYDSPTKTTGNKSLDAKLANTPETVAEKVDDSFSASFSSSSKSGLYQLCVFISCNGQRRVSINPL